MAFPKADTVKHKEGVFTRTGKIWKCETEECQKREGHSSLIEAATCGYGGRCTMRDIAELFPIGGDDGATLQDFERHEAEAILRVFRRSTLEQYWFYRHFFTGDRRTPRKGDSEFPQEEIDALKKLRDMAIQGHYVWRMLDEAIQMNMLVLGWLALNETEEKSPS